MLDQTDGVIAVPAGYKGTITDVIVRDGEIVTIGQRLFEVLLDPPMARDIPAHDSSAR
jgi:multidrug resistance efflux pump